MKNVLIVFYGPTEIMDLTPETTDQEIIEYCFLVYKYQTEAEAFWAYANKRCTYSTLVEDDTDVTSWIKNAYERIKSWDYDWLESNFI